MRKNQAMQQQNPEWLNIQRKQNMQDFNKRLEIKKQPTNIIYKPQKVIDAQQDKLIKLQQFKRSKIKIQQVIKQSKIKKSGQNKDQINLQKQQRVFKEEIQQEEQEEYIPCPFCANPLLLIDLGHIQNCQLGKKCSYCEEKYPSSLFYYHILACQKRPSFNIKKDLQLPNKRIKTQARQISSKRDKQQLEVKKKNKIQNKQIQQEAHKNIVLDFERKKYSEKKLQPYSKGIKQPIQSNKQPQNISQNVQAPINYAQHFNQLSRLRAEKQKGFSIKQLKSLRRETWGEQVGDCVICSEDYRPKVLVIKLPCSHFFHQDCLLPWLQSSRRCPTCRKQI